MNFQKPNTVGKHIAAARKAAGLSQEALAPRLYVTRQTISNWESGKSEPDIESLKALAETLSVPIEQLIYGKQATKEGQRPDTFLAALSEALPLEVWCRRLGIFALVWGLLSGISTGSGMDGNGHSVWFRFYWSDAFSIWYVAVIRGTILLGISRTLSLLKSKEP